MDTDNEMQIEKTVLAVFRDAQITQVKHRWNDPQNFAVMADIPSTKYIPELEKMIRNVLRGSSYYYKGIKRNYKTNYTFKVSLKK